MVKTTDGPEMGATVVSPALTSGAVSLLQKHLTDEEKELWSSLGPNWTLHCSQLVESVPPYSPVFLDGWQPEAVDPEGQLWEDPIKSQHKQDALQYSVEDPPNQAEEGPSSVQHTDESYVSDFPNNCCNAFCLLIHTVHEKHSFTTDYGTFHLSLSFMIECLDPITSCVHKTEGCF
uniref:epidermal growth factor receptor kinase substrate 8-like protein 1 n=1 Tax=Oncorhynchus gorbuscha TaxID=8017 RepID=UPI001EAF4E91|nr:epidermal growth factor receptor kinase substrate 8-like protein 1 [Oncorhynchus gorbuscha]